ncbi:hybrid sensor histidine kinase/response regulator [Hahella sp. CCB-MM4]|uniref:response regulator n=1 Tax=Hahella sp. (strain CCB-MM4) TaxID=1926491 RepID=UPI000B9BF794|nr:response regulator [Hahella sp. CCB-MM4]OZG70614.1 hybrid sensor histidine kinase/response regulator [Hahella sp. CCB-MM4]
MKHWGIKTKVILLTLIPTLGIAVIMSTAFVYTRLTDLNRSLLERGTDSVRHMANAAAYGMPAGQHAQLSSLTTSVLEERDIRSVTIYDRKRQILAHAGPKLLEPQTIPASLANQLTIYSSYEVLRFSMPIWRQAPPDPSATQENATQGNGAFTPAESQENLAGWAVVEVSRAPTDLAKYQTLLFAIVAVTLAVILCTYMALRLSRDLTRPLTDVSDALNRIREGKLDTRVFIEASPELANLQDGINSMAEALEKSRIEMQQNIDQATEDLRETLETIEIQNIELDLARKEALEASRVKSEFLANMSHEIRTPLNGIIGFTKLLSKSNLGIQQRDQLNTIYKSSEILLTIINDILDFSKIEAGKLILDNTSMNLREIVEDVLTMLAPGAHEKNLDLAGLIYSDVPEYIMGDPLRMKQIITNLVNNGIKFTQSGEVVVRVMLEDEDEHHRSTIKVTVTDTGVGLSRVQQNTLFNAFSQADASTARRFGGTGLGLVISRRLTEQMGGSIGVESELGKGSTFWIVLPVDIAPDQPEYDAGQPELAGERIIYLENQPKTGLAIRHTLQKWGAELKTVDNISELVESVGEAQQKGQGYAVALIGITRHHLRSTSYLEAIRQLEYSLDCRTLVLTPTITLGLEEPPILAEASNYLIKPPSQRRLGNALTQLITGAPVETQELGLDDEPPLQERDYKRAKVLAVDDNSANLKLVEAFLNELGAETDIANSGYEALTKAKLKKYDIIFMDVQMPGMDGIETTQRIRQFESGKRHTPIIALTAHALTDERQHLLKSGFDDYLTKPTNEEELQGIIARRAGIHLTLQSQPKANTPKSDLGKIKPSVKFATEPSVDLQNSIVLAGNKADLAEELFSMLLEGLPEDKTSIQKAFELQEQEILLERVHRLHGASRYCGVPALRRKAGELETLIKKGQPHKDELYALIDEIDRVQYWAERNDWQNSLRNFHVTHQAT